MLPTDKRQWMREYAPHVAKLALTFTDLMDAAKGLQHYTAIDKVIEAAAAFIQAETACRKQMESSGV